MTLDALLGYLSFGLIGAGFVVLAVALTERYWGKP